MLDALKQHIAAMEEYTLTPSTKIGLFGAGHYAPFIRDYIQKTGCHITCCIDNFQTGMLSDIPIVSIHDDCVSQLDIIFITTLPNAEAISQQLLSTPNARNIPHMHWDTFFIKQRIDSYQEVREVFCDEKSRYILDRLLFKAFCGELDYSDIGEEKQYFALTPFVLSHTETFINAGAYCGDTVEEFITIHHNEFNKILAFEPSKGNFLAMKRRAARLASENNIPSQKIVLYNTALGEKICKKQFLSTSQPTSRVVEDTYTSTSCSSIETISMTTIDEMSKDTTITLIAADIEGYELPMLQGGASTIRRDKPKMALSIYHRPDDLFEIVHYCKSLHEDYKFSLRHHLYTAGDTVLYCY